MNPIKPYTHNLFATHDSLSDALAYAKDIAAGCGTQSAYVMTAVMCVINTASKEVDTARYQLLHVLHQLVYNSTPERINSPEFHQALARAQAVLLSGVKDAAALLSERTSK